MRKTLFALLLAVTLIIPSMALAGEGATTWYSPWFNDKADMSPNPYGMGTWIQVSNPNSYAAELEITYYQVDGTVYTDGSSNSVFTHSIPARGRIAWRPNQDLDLTSGEIKGSYIINAIEGSVTVEETVCFKADSSIDDGFRGDGDVVDVWTKQPQTITSTFMTMDSLMEWETGNSDNADLSGEVTTVINLNNPSDDFDAEAEVSFYSDNGTFINNNTSTPTLPITLTFGPHETHIFTPYEYGVNGTSETSPTKGSVIVDVKKGSLVGSYAKHYCQETTGDTPILEYRSYGAMMNKRLIVK